MRWAGETEEQAAERKAKRLANWHTKYAFIPTQLSDGTWVWLEKYYQRYKPLNEKYAPNDLIRERLVYDSVK